MPSRHSHVAELLQQWSRGNESALANLTPIVEKELHRRARMYMSRERMNHTLQPTALVNEVYLRLVGSANVQFEARPQFYAFCAKIMKRVLVDHARERSSKKRGGDIRLTSFDEASVAAQDKGIDVLQLDEALQALRKLHSRQADVVDLRFFGGLSVDETAEALKVSKQTVLRDWSIAKVWLLRFIKEKAEA